MQANKFGASLPVGTQVTGLSFDAGCPVIELDGGETIRSRCLLIATGAEYRMLGIPGCDQFEGRGIYYAATPLEAQMCRGSDVLVVGGGNSAGQAAVFLSSQVGKVYLAVRGDSLYVKMSSYLARRIEDTPRIEVLLNTEVRRVSGEEALNEVELVNRKTGEGWTIRVPAVQLHRGGAADRLAPARDRARREAIRPHGAGTGPVDSLDGPPAAVLSRNQPARRLRRGRRTLGLGQARCIGRGRRLDGRPARARVSSGGGPDFGLDHDTGFRPRFDVECFL